MRKPPANAQNFRAQIIWPYIWAQLYKERITLFNGQIVIQPIIVNKMYKAIHCIAIYLVDSIIQHLNNQGLEASTIFLSSFILS